MLAVIQKTPTEGLSAARRRVCCRVPHLAARVERLMRIATIAASGPDPEAALPQLEAARRSLAAFLRLTPRV